MSPCVIVRLPPDWAKLCDLLCWGRVVGKPWMGLITWSTYVHRDAGTGHLYFSGWVPGHLLWPSADPAVRHDTLECLELPISRSAWPVPSGHQGLHWVHYGFLSVAPPPLDGDTNVIAGGYPSR